MEKPIQPGSVVFSRAGRDKGNYFMVFEVVDERFVLLVDGSLRKLDAPKKKSVKHVKHTLDELDAIAKKLKENVKVYDEEIFSALRRYNI